MIEDLYQKVETILNDELRYWDCPNALEEEVIDRLSETDTITLQDEYLISSQVHRWWKKQNFNPDPDLY